MPTPLHFINPLDSTCVLRVRFNNKINSVVIIGIRINPIRLFSAVIDQITWG